MQIKVCGMREPENIRAVAALEPDMMGFIFYPSSPRYVEVLPSSIVQDLPEDILRVGVFVNETTKNIMDIVARYSIQCIQLHGEESPEQCAFFRQKGKYVAKAIGIEDRTDFRRCEEYQSCCDFLVLDTKSAQKGGSGKAFNWNLLEAYQGKLPFLLSGGISTADTERILAISYPQCMGVDVNSGFEIVPGRKDTEKLGRFILEMRKNTRL